MESKKICLASDNWTPAHPLIMQAVIEANVGVAPAYGADPWTEEAEKLIQTVFKSPCQVFFVPTGTGANVLGLKIACRRHESVLCTDIAHLQYQECGAAESIVGCKLLSIPHQEGKISPSGLLKKLKSERAFGKHSTSPRILSITQSTEVGTVYTLQELEALSQIAKQENLLLHIDGSRFYNAAVCLNASFHEMLHAARADILSLGGTKNGLLGAEALVIFNPALKPASDYLQKQTLQLLSKMRYLSAQYIPFFKKELWHQLASHANQKAREIAQIIQSTAHLALSYPVETNQVFFTAPASWGALIQEQIFCYPWDQEKGEIRFIASWNTSDEDVKNVERALTEISRQPI
jgi:threonine aldolase